MPDTMTSKERVLAAINHQKVDRVPSCIANMMYFIGRHNKIKIADYLANPSLSMELGYKMFEELGGYDLVPNTAPPSPKSPFAENTAYIFAPLKMMQPGKELPPDSIPQILEIELMKPEDYDIVIEKGWLFYAKEYIKPQLGTQGFGSAPPPDSSKRSPVQPPPI